MQYFKTTKLFWVFDKAPFSNCASAQLRFQKIETFIYVKFNYIAVHNSLKFKLTSQLLLTIEQSYTPRVTQTKVLFIFKQPSYISKVYITKEHKSTTFWLGLIQHTRIGKHISCSKLRVQYSIQPFSKLTNNSKCI